MPAEGSGWPLVVAIRGGAWMTGSKEPAGAFLELGFAVASINDRLSQHATFPAQNQDGKAAVRWLRAHAADYGYDPDRFASYGPSAGGHLAPLLGTPGTWRPPTWAGTWSRSLSPARRARRAAGRR